MLIYIFLLILPHLGCSHSASDYSTTFIKHAFLFDDIKLISGFKLFQLFNFFPIYDIQWICIANLSSLSISKIELSVGIFTRLPKRWK